MIAQSLMRKKDQIRSGGSFNMNATRLLSTLCLFLSVAVAGRSQSSYRIIVGTTTGADISNIASSLGGTVVDSMPGGTYLVDVSTLPTSLPAGASYIEYNGNARLLGGFGAVAKVNPTTDPDFYNGQ